MSHDNASEPIRTRFAQARTARSRSQPVSMTRLTGHKRSRVNDTAEKQHGKQQAPPEKQRRITLINPTFIINVYGGNNTFNQSSVSKVNSDNVRSFKYASDFQVDSGNKMDFGQMNSSFFKKVSKDLCDEIFEDDKAAKMQQPQSNFTNANNANGNENAKTKTSNNSSTAANSDGDSIGLGSGDGGGSIAININKEINVNSNNQRSCMYASKFIGGSKNVLNFGNFNQSETVKGGIVTEIKDDNGTFDLSGAINGPNGTTKTNLNVENKYNTTTVENCNNTIASHFEGGDNNILNFGKNNQESRKNTSKLTINAGEVNVTNDNSNHVNITDASKRTNATSICITNSGNINGSFVHGGSNNQTTFSHVGQNADTAVCAETTISDNTQKIDEHLDANGDENENENDEDEIQDIDVNPNENQF